MEVTLDLIDGKWKGVILYHLQEGRLRFGELRQRPLLAPTLAERIELVRKPTADKIEHQRPPCLMAA